MQKPTVSYRLLETIPGLVSWGIIAFAIILIFIEPVAFVGLLILFTTYWVVSCFRIVFLSWSGYRKIDAVQTENWTSKLDQDHPEWKDYYYCALLPFASESAQVVRPTIQSIVDSTFPAERKILCLSSEKALPKGLAVAELMAKEFAGKFAHIFITEHELKPGELKGKASNQNHSGRFVYEEIQKLGIDPAKVLLSSNDADVLNDPQYQAYLLHTYLSNGDNKDNCIYQPIPTDYNNYWEATFFSRIIISTGVLWRIALQARADYRCTVYSFYSMTLKTLNDIGFWDVDLIPEDERTMFKALEAFGLKFKVIPLFILTRGSPVKGDHIIHSFREQYVQIRRWAWGASEFAHSVTRYMNADAAKKKALLMPIVNQIRTSTEWSLASLFLMFGGALPGILVPEFSWTQLGHVYPIILSSFMSLATLLIFAIVILDVRIAPKRPKDRGPLFTILTYSQWLFAPIVGLILSSIPALEAQTRLIFNKRIAYIESRKE